MAWSGVRRRPSFVVVRLSHFQQSISLQPVGRSLSNFMWSIIRLRKRLHNVFRLIGVELWLPRQHIAPIDLTWEKSCHHTSSFNLFQIAFILADNKYRHKILVKFDFGLNRVVHSGVTYPWPLENFPMDLTWGKYCHHNSRFFYWIGFNLAGNQ